jgi:hypothetical protein
MKQEQIIIIANGVQEYVVKHIPQLKYGKIVVEISLMDNKVVNVSKGAYENEKPIY